MPPIIEKPVHIRGERNTSGWKGLLPNAYACHNTGWRLYEDACRTRDAMARAPFVSFSGVLQTQTELAWVLGQIALMGVVLGLKAFLAWRTGSDKDANVKTHALASKLWAKLDDKDKEALSRAWLDKPKVGLSEIRYKDISTLLSKEDKTYTALRYVGETAKGIRLPEVEGLLLFLTVLLESLKVEGFARQLDAGLGITDWPEQHDGYGNVSRSNFKGLLKGST